MLVVRWALTTGRYPSRRSRFGLTDGPRTRRPPVCSTPWLRRNPLVVFSKESREAPKHFLESGAYTFSIARELSNQPSLLWRLRLIVPSPKKQHRRLRPIA